MSDVWNFPFHLHKLQYTIVIFLKLIIHFKPQSCLAPYSIIIGYSYETYRRTHKPYFQFTRFITKGKEKTCKSKGWRERKKTQPASIETASNFPSSQLKWKKLFNNSNLLALSRFICWESARIFFVVLLVIRRGLITVMESVIFHVWLEISE